MNYWGDIDIELIKIITYRFQKDWLTLSIFILLGFILAHMGFEQDKESYLSFLNTVAGVVATLIGFIGIFVVYRLQNITNIRDNYAYQINILKSELKPYENDILITQYNQPDIINRQLDRIKEIITTIDREIDREIDSQSADTKRISILSADRSILKKIEYTLELILKNISLEKSFSMHKDYILFAMCSIFLFVVSIAFSHNNFLNDCCTVIFNNWNYVKMSFTGLLFGLFFIVLKDLASMLTKLLMHES